MPKDRCKTIRFRILDEQRMMKLEWREVNHEHESLQSSSNPRHSTEKHETQDMEEETLLTFY